MADLVTVNMTFNGVVVPVQLDPSSLPTGLQGPPGPAGPAPSPEDLQQAISSYMASNAAISSLAAALAAQATVVDVQTLAQEVAQQKLPIAAGQTTSVSPNATKIGLSNIVDAQGNSWTLQSGVAYQNGVEAGTNYNVTELYYLNGKIYQKNTQGLWWVWNGSSWTSTPTPAGG